MLLPRLESLTFSSGASPVTVTDSCTPDTAICRFTTACCPTRSVIVRAIDAKPVSSAVILYVPTRIGSRNPPAASVTASKLLPFASLTARTTTPGSAPPVSSVTVPLRLASCACANSGIARMAATMSHR